MSTMNGVGSRHSSDSGGSVRWDEERLESVIAVRKRERLKRKRERETVREKAEAGKDAKGKKDKKGSKISIQEMAGSGRHCPRCSSQVRIFSESRPKIPQSPCNIP